MSGSQALAVAKREELDAALIEINLPDQRGLELVGRLSMRHPRMICAVMTSSDSVRDALEALKVGVVRYLFKPFAGVSSVTRIIRMSLGEREAKIRRAHSVSIVDAELHKGLKTPEVPLKVLLAVPHDELQAELVKTLGLVGCEAVMSKTGRETLTVLGESRYEAVVLSNDMGDMLANDIIGRARRTIPDVSFIVIANSPTVKMVARFIRLGVDDVLTDPLGDRVRTARSILRYALATRTWRFAGSLDELMNRAALYTTPPPKAEPHELEPPSPLASYPTLDEPDEAPETEPTVTAETRSTRSGEGRASTQPSSIGAGRASTQPRTGGSLLLGKYRLLDEIGRGTNGTVFRAHDESRDAEVALRLLRPELQNDLKFKERFHRKVRAMASVRHENVVAIYSLGEAEGHSFFVMEYTEGQTAAQMLMELVQRGALLPSYKALWLIEHIVAGLGAIHDAGVTHGDVRPSNIILEAESGHPMLVDFGIPRRGDTGPRLVGHKPFVAPEVEAGRAMTKELRRASDIFALGCTIYELLTTSVPVPPIHERPPSADRPGLPPSLDQLVLKCLAERPEDRVSSCDEIREALQHVPDRTWEPTPSPRPLPSSSPSSSPHSRPSSRPEAAELSREAPLPRPRPSSEVADYLERVSRASASPSSVAAECLPKEPRPRPRLNYLRANIVVADHETHSLYAIMPHVMDVFPKCKLRAARTSRQAVELALDVPPVLLVARLDAPDLDGFELTKLIRGHPDLCDTQILLTATRVTAGERRLLEEMAVFAVLLHPIPAHKLVSTLEQLATIIE